MAVKLRLARGGSRRRPHYSIVAADSQAPRDGRFIEKIGRYNPLLPKDNDQRVVIDLEAAKKWLGQGAQPTDRVARFLGEAGVIAWTHGHNPKKGEPGLKAKERLAEQAKASAAKAEDAVAGEPASDETPPSEASDSDETPASSEAEAASGDASEGDEPSATG